MAIRFLIGIAGKALKGGARAGGLGVGFAAGAARGLFADQAKKLSTASKQRQRAAAGRVRGTALGFVSREEREFCKQYEADFRQELENHLRIRAPKDTGRLRRSIKVTLRQGGHPCSGTFVITMEKHGWYQDRFNGKHKGWIDRATREVMRGAGHRIVRSGVV